MRETTAAHPRHDMPLALTKGQIRTACGDGAFARGLDYVRNHRVLDVQVQETDTGLQLNASVRGSAVYRQQIEVDDFMGHVEIEGECSCPVAYNCKHVAAVLITLLEGTHPQAHRRARLEVWMGRLEAAGSPGQWLPDLGERVLLYALRPAPRSPHHIEVGLQLGRVLKSGKGYGKARKLGLYETYQARVREAAQPIDDTILGLLGSMSEYAAPVLRGDLGAIALARMLSTGRTHWLDSHNPPLRPGGPRPLLSAWRRQRDGLHLALDTEPGGALVLALDPPAYLDPHSATVGPLELPPGLGHRVLEALLEAPPVPQDLALEVSDRLLQRFPQTPLPLPAVRELEELRDLTPTPVLRLIGHRGGQAAEARRMPLLMLQFDYAGHRVGLPSTPVSQLADAGRVTRIVRDVQREGAALGRLLAAGFEGGHAPELDAPALTPRAHDIGESARCWQRFLEHELPALRADGWIVEQDEDFALRFLRAADLVMDIEERGGWFDLGIGIEVEGRRIDLVPVLARLVERFDRAEDLPDDQPTMLEIAEGQWLELPASRVKPLLTALFDLFDRAAPDDTALRLRRIDAARLPALGDDITWQGGEALRRLGRRLADLREIPAVPAPDGLQAELRPYQLHGLAWLQFLRETGFGGILADDMGLGKTVQTLAHLLTEKRAGRLDRPALIVAPTSLMANWRHEAARFTPELRLLTLHGPGRKRHFDAIGDHDLVLTTYPLLSRDQAVLRAQAFHCLILDEAQNIKNPRARASQIACGLDARQRLCLSGTPMENHLGELWSLFHFLAPGYLGDQQTFRRLFRSPIEQHGDPDRRLALQRRVAPFLLRRTKQAVAGELPEKVEIVRTVALPDAQAGLYESVRATMDDKVSLALRRKGLARSHITILDALLRLRQICCDPRLLKLDSAQRVRESAKLELLLEMLPELLAEGRRILLFSQFTSMLGLIEAELKRLDIAYAKLTGQTRQREKVIEQFRSGAVPLFLISLKAGGVGLNLTEADTVIHYDPWWNPAVENQATDRAHRIGQTSTVFVYKLVTEQTVEEKILALQARKAALADGLYREGGGEQGLNLSEDDLRELLRPVG